MKTDLLNWKEQEHSLLAESPSGLPTPEGCLSTKTVPTSVGIARTSKQPSNREKKAGVEK
jgi:hypothetical protein